MNPYYRAFTPDHDPADAVHQFEARYGAAPAEAPRLDRGVLWVGPVPEGEDLTGFWKPVRSGKSLLEDLP